MNNKVKKFVENLSIEYINDDRKVLLNTVVDFIQQKKDAAHEVKLVFVCTHNSRRSQLSELWASVLADFYGIEVNTFSGGVEVTEFNHRAIKSLKGIGFDIDQELKEQPYYHFLLGNSGKPKIMFSKMYDDKINPESDFAALMTCSDADENCPFIPGTAQRIPLRYDDPKAFDDTPKESAAYDLKSKEIATEMKYIFSKIK
jgi:arsenate reductase (thioredoxin)